jgi:hypothetical protein
MKTSELIKTVKDKVRIKAVVEGLYITFYEWDSEEEFYRYPVDGTDIGAGISYMWNIGDVSMRDIFNLGEILKEYGETPVNERKEEKKYYVWIETMHEGYIHVIYRDITSDSGFNDYFCRSIDDFVYGNDQRFKVVSRLTEKDIMRLLEKFIPKQFGGLGFTECVEVKE